MYFDVFETVNLSLRDFLEDMARGVFHCLYYIPKEG